MKILVTGCGRSCTNWVSEIVKSTNNFNWIGTPEDRNFFQRLTLPPQYASKLATENKGFNANSLLIMSKVNPDLRFLWCFKHPVANVMAKIVRGRPASEGGDKRTENTSDDGHLDTAIAAVKKSYEIYSEFKDISLDVRVERLIEVPVSMESFLEDYLEASRFDLNSFRNTPNKYHQKRYGKKVDKSQAKIYENWKTAYDGYFADKEDWIQKMREELEGACKGLGYGL